MADLYDRLAEQAAEKTPANSFLYLMPLTTCYQVLLEIVNNALQDMEDDFLKHTATISLMDPPEK